MSAWEWIVAVILFIIALTLIITIHELGHFSMAKLFNVYCHQFSIGFGPAIFKKKRKNGETTFVLRAFPLGGYVSMYGEDTEFEEEGLVLTDDRSIEGIKKWKKVIIVSAGVILNAVTALVLMFISNVAFPVMHTSSYAEVTPNSVAYKLGVREDNRLAIIHDKGREIINDDGSTSIMPYSATFTNDKGSLEATAFFILDSNVVLNDNHYVLTYYPVTNKTNNVLSECLKLYVGMTKEEVESDDDMSAMFGAWLNEDKAPDYYPNYKKKFEFKNEEISAVLTFNVAQEGKEPDLKQFNFKFVSIDGKVQDVGLNLKIIKEWLPFSQRLENTFIDFGDASIAVFRGIGSLFTGGIRNMSGFVGIFNISAELYSSYTFARYLYFWGLISVNLAIFNLLPFPGLDGWQILVTCVEGITKKKIPSKVKAIMSYVGLALVFALMIAILAMDVMRIVGVI